MSVVIERADGTEEVLETVPSYQEKPNEVHKDSGLYQSLEMFLGEQTKETTNGASKDEKSEKPAEKKPEEEKEKTPLSDLDKGEGAEKDKKSEAGQGLDDKDKGEKGEVTDGAKVLTPEEITTLKTEFETKETEYKNQVQNLQTQLENLKKDKSGIPDEVQKFLDELRGDAEGAWNKYRSKLNLPDFGLVKSQFAGGGQAARLKQHIESVIKPQIEKEYSLEKGQFKFDLAQAEEDPTSASARFLELKRDKESQLKNEVKSVEQRESDVAKAVKSQNEGDLKYIADKYYDGKIEEAQKLHTEINKKAIAVITGQAKPEEHPFALRHIARGFLHDTLVQKAVDETRNTLLQQIREMGIHLPDKEFPTDLKQVKAGATKETNKSSMEIEKSKFSPMLQSIENSL